MERDTNQGATQEPWRRWRMSQLERQDSPPSSDVGEKESSLHREDQVVSTLVDLAREQAEARGYEAGYERGLAAGRTEGEANARAEHESELAGEVAQKVEPIETLVKTFQAALESVEQHLGYQIAELAIETGQQLAGRALEIKPDHILDDIEDLLATHPHLSGMPTLFVNVEDLELVQSQLGETMIAAGWSLRTDVNLERGDCRIETEQHEIDATLEDRWARLLHVVGHAEH